MTDMSTTGSTGARSTGARSIGARFLERSTNLRNNVQSGLRARRSGAASFGPQPLLRGKLCFRFDGTVTIGARFDADGLIMPVSISVVEGATLSIGDDLYMNAGTSIEVWHDVRIGSNCLFGPFASVIDDDRHEVEPGAILHKGPTILGNNVWLGRSAAVMPGVTVGDGSVVGANSVVTRDIPPNSFAAGAPARVIRKLELPDGWVRR
jgi:acetyltransferase-like isoleucine patch superfamily enzyme